MNLKKFITTAAFCLLSLGTFGAGTAFAVRPPPPPHIVYTFWYDCRADTASCEYDLANNTYSGQDWCGTVKWSDGSSTYTGYCYD